MIDSCRWPLYHFFSAATPQECTDLLRKGSRLCHSCKKCWTFNSTETVDVKPRTSWPSTIWKIWTACCNNTASASFRFVFCNTLPRLQQAKAARPRIQIVSTQDCIWQAKYWSSQEIFDSSWAAAGTTSQIHGQANIWWIHSATVISPAPDGIQPFAPGQEKLTPTRSLTPLKRWYRPANPNMDHSKMSGWILAAPRWQQTSKGCHQEH
jgi:hypothetical protein